MDLSFLPELGTAPFRRFRTKEVETVATGDLCAVIGLEGFEVVIL